MPGTPGDEGVGALSFNPFCDALRESGFLESEGQQKRLILSRHFRLALVKGTEAADVLDSIPPAFREDGTDAGVSAPAQMEPTPANILEVGGPHQAHWHKVKGRIERNQGETLPRKIPKPFLVAQDVQKDEADIPTRKQGPPQPRGGGILPIKGVEMLVAIPQRTAESIENLFKPHCRGGRILAANRWRGLPDGVRSTLGLLNLNHAPLKSETVESGTGTARSLGYGLDIVNLADYPDQQAAFRVFRARGMRSVLLWMPSDQDFQLEADVCNFIVLAAPIGMKQLPVHTVSSNHYRASHSCTECVPSS